MLLSSLFLSIGIWLLEGACKAKSLLPKRAKPKVDKADIYFHQLMDGEPCDVCFRCTFLADNGKGTKDCSLTNIEIFVNGESATRRDMLEIVDSTPLPVAIAPGRSEKVMVLGRWVGSRATEKDVYTRIPVMVTVNFNTGKEIKINLEASHNPHLFSQ